MTSVLIFTFKCPIVAVVVVVIVIVIVIAVVTFGQGKGLPESKSSHVDTMIQDTNQYIDRSWEWLPPYSQT